MAPLERRNNRAPRRPRRLLRLGAVAGLIAGLVSGLATAVLAQKPSAPEGSAREARDDVWRMIFARPPEPPAAATPASDLGRDLFNDPRLSGDMDQSCAGCHNPGNGFTDGRPTGAGRRGVPLTRNVPALYDVRWGKAFFWDGRAASLEAQAKGPIEADNEMAGRFDEIASRLAADPAMPGRFAAAFPSRPAIDEPNILAALAAYERTIASPPTRFDRWVEGDDGALTAEEKAGFAIFVGKGGCVSCHGGWRFTDDAFHDIGLPGSDPGRGAVAGGSPGLPEFKTPSLREAVHTAPYMHDGSLATLADVVEHYAEKRILRPSLAPTIERNLSLTKEEKADLVRFLKTLSSGE